MMASGYHVKNIISGENMTSLFFLGTVASLIIVLILTINYLRKQERNTRINKEPTIITSKGGQRFIKKDATIDKSGENWIFEGEIITKNNKNKIPFIMFIVPRGIASFTLWQDTNNYYYLVELGRAKKGKLNAYRAGGEYNCKEVDEEAI